MKKQVCKPQRYDPILEKEIKKFQKELETVFGKNVSMREASKIYANLNRRQLILIEKTRRKKKRGVSDLIW